MIIYFQLDLKVILCRQDKGREIRCNQKIVEKRIKYYPISRKTIARYIYGRRELEYGRKRKIANLFFTS